MPALLCVVPVLSETGRSDGMPIAAVRLRGHPLFMHCVQTVRSFTDAALLVTAPRGSERSVLGALAAGGLPDVPVLGVDGRLGPALLAALDRADPDGHVLLHDARCPLAPAGLLREAVDSAHTSPDAVVVAVRPMTDTVKAFVDGVVRGTVDRDLLQVVVSPVVLPTALLRRLERTGELVGCVDVDALIQLVRREGAELRWVQAPAPARRVGDAAAVTLLECLTDLH